MDFNERIISARKAKGYSQEDLADIVNVSRQAVSKWETGDAMPDMEKCIALCEALDLSAEYLLLGKEISPPPPAPKKALHWLGITLLAILCLGGGFCAGHFAFPREAPEPTVQTVVVEKEVIVEKEVMKEVAKDSPLADVLYSPKKAYAKLSILPAVVEEDMHIEILYEDLNSRSGPKEVSCTFDGTYFKCTLPRGATDYHYYIIAVITVNGKLRQIPLLDITGNANSYQLRPLWKSF